jgi:hypothetical protein
MHESRLIEFPRTAQRLNHLAVAAGSADPDDIADLVIQADEVISVENQGWMTKLAEDPPAHEVPAAPEVRAPGT